jgi:hypothetical protein
MWTRLNWFRIGSNEPSNYTEVLWCRGVKTDIKQYLMHLEDQYSICCQQHITISFQLNFNPLINNMKSTTLKILVK